MADPLHVSCPTCDQPEGCACGFVPSGTSHFARIVAAVREEFQDAQDEGPCTISADIGRMALTTAGAI